MLVVRAYNNPTSMIGGFVDSILELQHLSKRYGEHVAVDDLSFSVPRGSVFGLLGPNGAGKTTTIRMIMRIISADSGSVLLDGLPVDDDRRRIIGYLPEERGLYKKMKVLEHLVYLGTIRGLRPGEAKKRAGAWLEKFGLAEWATHKVEDLSKGMQQKIQVIGTILHRPPLLILDEPFSGLDPINTRQLKDLMRQMADEGVTIVLSTHVLPQVDELCSDICLINRARPILYGSLERIRADYGGNTWRVRSDMGEDELAGLPGVTSVHALGEERLIELEDGREARDLLRALVDRSQVESFTRFVPDLENIFIRAVEEDRTHAE
jgi:ABC-2 type transport system ATP-binding protein